jgi:hypothetical protein
LGTWHGKSRATKTEKQVFMPMRIAAILVAMALTCTGQAHADACDYTVSKLTRKTATEATGGNGMTGAGLQSAGNYTLAHAGSGLTMLATTASAATSLGLISSTSSLLASVGSVLMAPATLIVGGIAVIGVGSLEGYCYFQVKRITDPFEVREVIESIAANDDAVSIVKTEEGPAMALEEAGKTKTYLLRKLYIADGQLKYRTALRDTNLGPVSFKSKQLDESTDLAN